VSPEFLICDVGNRQLLAGRRQARDLQHRPDFDGSETRAGNAFGDGDGDGLIEIFRIDQVVAAERQMSYSKLWVLRAVNTYRPSGDHTL